MDRTKALIAATGTLAIIGGGSLLLPEGTTPAAELTKATVDGAIVVEIATKQAEYKDKSGKYLQVSSGNKLPEGELGTVIEKLGINSPYRVDVYSGPEGDGYQIIADTPEGEVSYGFGPEAVDRTYIRTKEVLIASTTKK